MTTTESSPAGQDYLKTLLRLGASKETVPVGELAEGVGVKAPSATEMIHRITDEGWVRHQPGRGSRLTIDGAREAARVVRRHRLLELFLTRALGLPWHEVHEEAEVLEHYVSPRLERAVADLLGQPTEDPHGHLIPDADGKLRDVRGLMPFEEVLAGDTVIIRECSDADSERLARWKLNSFVPGAEVQVLAVDQLDDIFELSVAERIIRVGSRGLRDIRVEKVSSAEQA